MRGLFRILGIGVAFYVVQALRSGTVSGKNGFRWSDFNRDDDAWGYWGTVGSYALLSLALEFIF